MSSEARGGWNVKCNEAVGLSTQRLSDNWVGGLMRCPKPKAVAG